MQKKKTFNLWGHETRPVITTTKSFNFFFQIQINSRLKKKKKSMQNSTNKKAKRCYWPNLTAQAIYASAFNLLLRQQSSDAIIVARSNQRLMFVSIRTEITQAIEISSSVKSETVDVIATFLHFSRATYGNIAFLTFS